VVRGTALEITHKDIYNNGKGCFTEYTIDLSGLSANVISDRPVSGDHDCPVIIGQTDRKGEAIHSKSYYVKLVDGVYERQPVFISQSEASLAIQGLDSQEARRLANALKHAIALSGGKPAPIDPFDK
jgi:hypothetical protein